MAQIPYSPVPSNAESLPATPSIHVDTPLAAFGGNIADAISRLGQTTDQVGNEIFTRAMSMQQLHNEVSAREAGTRTMEQSNQLVTDFTTKMGKDASPEALMEFNKSLADMRVKNGSDLNPMARSLYDADTYNYMGWNMRAASRHSSQQLQAYAKATNTEQIARINDGVLSRPQDEDIYNAGREQAIAAARDNAIHDGKSDADIDFAGKQAGSSVTFSRIAGIAKTHPQAARALLDKANTDGTLTGQDSVKLDDFVTRQMYSTGSKTIADETRSGTNLAMGQAQVPIERAKDAIAMGIESGGNYQAHVGAALGKYQVMPANLQSWLRQSGQDAMTPEEFLKNPGAQDRVFETIFGGLMKKYGNFNDAASAWFTGVPYDQAVAEKRHDSNINVQEYLSAVNARLAKTASASDKVAAVRAQAAKVDPDHPLLQDYSESNMITKDNQDAALKRQDDQSRWNTIDGALITKPGVPTPASIDDMKKDPEVARAIEGLDQAGQLKLQHKLEIASKQDDTMTPVRKGNFEKINGVARIDPARFADMDLFGTDLTATQRQSLQQMKKQVIEGKQLDDPHLNIALRSPNVQAQMKAAGIKKDPDNPGEYEKFVGALQDQIQQARAAGKPLSYQDTEGIALRLLQDQSTGPGMFSDWTDKMYRVPPPEEEKAKMIKQNPGVNLTEDQMQRLYTRKLFRDSISKDTKSTGRLNMQATPGAPQAK